MLFVWIGLFGQVPDNNTFSLQDVVDVVNPTTDDLEDCFNDAIASYFDSNYEGNKDRLSNFRNYGYVEIVPCDAESEYPGGVAYPTEVTYSLGSGTGTVVLEFTVHSIPDRFIVYYDGNVVIDTGYWGDSSHDYGGVNRSDFTDALYGKDDPITDDDYPDFTNFPDDGYPRISPGISSQRFFTKFSAIPTNVTVEVYAPMALTEWNFTLYCPE